MLRETEKGQRLDLTVYVYGRGESAYFVGTPAEPNARPETREEIHARLDAALDAATG